MNKISRRSFVPMLGTALVGASCLSMQDKSALQFIPQNTLLPKRLAKGDTIGVCAPAGCIKNTDEISEFKGVLENLGFNVKIGKNVSKQFGYFSASDKERAAELMTFVEDPTIDGIFFIRGGWGCARILDHLNFEAIKNNPKVIMGFSDITTLLNAISMKTGLITFHGPGGNSTWNEYSLGYIKRLIFDAEPIVFKNNIEDLPITTFSSGTCTGELYGGNLSVLTSLIGSKYLPDWKNKILFLEDVNEEPYRIDRMLTQLSLAGVFTDVKGVILGNFRKCIAEEIDRSFTLEEVFEQHFKKLGKPVFYGAQIGHIRNKFTIPVGCSVTMNADTGEFEMSHAAVS